MAALSLMKILRIKLLGHYGPAPSYRPSAAGIRYTEALTLRLFPVRRAFLTARSMAKRTRYTAFSQHLAASELLYPVEVQ